MNDLAALYCVVFNMLAGLYTYRAVFELKNSGWWVVVYILLVMLNGGIITNIVRKR